MKDVQEMSAKDALAKGSGADGGPAKAKHGGSKRGEPSASVQPDVQARLGDKLKEVYSDVLNAPVPDRFTELLAKLETSDTAPDTAPGSSRSGGGSGE